MVDRSDRERLAVRLRRLADGRITNDDFDEEVPSDSPDRGVQEIARFGWTLYDDLRHYRLRGRDALNRATLRRVGLCILFLHSSNEYDWPRHPKLGAIGIFLSIVTLGRFDLRHHNDAWVRWFGAGDLSVWPFLRWDDFERAQRAPRLLGGRGEAAA